MVRFIGTAPRLGKGQRPQKLSLKHEPERWAPVFRKDHAQTRTASERANGGHALDKLERASLLRRGVDALRQHELHLAGVVEAEHEAELPLAAARPHLLSEGGKGARVLDIDLHADVARLSRLVERDDALHAYFDVLAVGLGFNVEQ